MIVKIQKSIYGENSFLLYDKNRTVFYEAPIDKEIKSLFKKGVYKVYYRAEIEGTQVRLFEQVADQSW